MLRNRLAAVIAAVFLGLFTVACEADVDVPEGGVEVEGGEAGEGEGEDG